MDTLGTPQLETTHSSQAHGHLPPLMIGVLLWETGRWRWVKTDQVSGGWVGLVLNPASGRGASLRQAETDSSRDMIIYRVDIGAFGGGEERWLLGEAWTYFPLGVFSLGSGCFFLDVTGRDCPPPAPPCQRTWWRVFLLSHRPTADSQQASSPALPGLRLYPLPSVAFLSNFLASQRQSLLSLTQSRLKCHPELPGEARVLSYGVILSKLLRLRLAQPWSLLFFQGHSAWPRVLQPLLWAPMVCQALVWVSPWSFLSSGKVRTKGCRKQEKNHPAIMDQSFPEGLLCAKCYSSFSLSPSLPTLALLCANSWSRGWPCKKPNKHKAVIQIPIDSFMHTFVNSATGSQVLLWARGHPRGLWGANTFR